MGDIVFYEISCFSWKMFSFKKHIFFNISKINYVYKSAYSSWNNNALWFLRTRMESRRQPDGNGFHGYTNSITFGGHRLLQNYIFFLDIFFLQKTNIFFSISKITSVYKSAYSSWNANALRFLKTGIKFRRPPNGNGVQGYTNSITVGGRRRLQNFIFFLEIFFPLKKIFF